MKLVYKIFDFIVLVLWCFVVPAFYKLPKQKNPLGIPVIIMLAIILINSFLLPKVVGKENYDGYYVAIRVLLFLLPEIFGLIRHFLF